MKKIFFLFTMLTLCANPSFADTGDDAWTELSPSDLAQREKTINKIKDVFSELKSAKPGYTIDRRKYVISFEKTMAPFSSIVALQDKKKRNFCTATLTTDGIVVTAKHCVVDGGPAHLVLISKEQTLKYDLLERSSADIYDDNGRYINAEQDFAFMSVLGDAPDGIGLATVDGASMDAMVVGYGGLRVLSDDEIKTIRHQYANWLKERNLKPSEPNEVADADGVDLASRGATGSAFINDIYAGKIAGVDKNIFSDAGRLKKSYCRVGKDGDLTNCQIWGGNSGGPVFAKSNKHDKWYLVGEVVSGNVAISNSASRHARGAHFVPISVFRKNYDAFLQHAKKRRALSEMLSRKKLEREKR